MEQWRISSPME